MQFWGSLDQADGELQSKKHQLVESCVGLEPLAKLILWSSVIGWEQPGKRVGVKAGTDFEEAAAEGGQLTRSLQQVLSWKIWVVYFPRGHRRT